MRLLAVLSICGLALLIGSGCQKKKVTPGFEAPKGDVVQQQAKAEPQKQEEKPPAPVQKEETKPELKEAPKERQGLVYNVRMAAMRPEIQNDMRTIGQFYQAAVAEGSPPKTKEQFMEMIKSDRRLVSKFADNPSEVEALSPIYKVNLHGKKLQPTDVLAYEWEASSPNGWCVVQANGQVETNMPLDELKQKLGMK
jgi:hypothetical protein